MNKAERIPALVQFMLSLESCNKMVLRKCRDIRAHIIWSVWLLDGILQEHISKEFTCSSSAQKEKSGHVKI